MLNTVYVLVGMPGVGKSTWINKNYPHLPVVSSDNFIDLLRDRIRLFRRTCSLRWLTVMSDPTALMGLTKSAM